MLLIQRHNTIFEVRLTAK